jgi:hypothetical protein
MIDYIKLAGAKSKGKRPFFFENIDSEKVLNISMAIGTELAVVRERLDTIERLLEQKGIISREEIESYEPDDEAAYQRQQIHAEYIARILRILQQEMEAIAKPELNKNVADIADDMEDM